MLFPIGDDNSRVRSTPFLVYIFFLINLAVWLLQLYWGEAFTFAYSMVPRQILTGADLVGTFPIPVDGRMVPITLYPSPQPVYLTLFTSMFMHGGWLHIGVNMLYLWIFGDQVEDRLGHFRFFIFYFLCGLAAAMAQFVMAPNSIIPMLGASGAIAGVLGAYLMKFPANGVRVVVFFYGIVQFPAYIVLGFWIFLQVISQVGAAGDGGGVAYMAHIGGFVAGLVLTRWMAPKSRSRSGRMAWRKR